MTTYILSPSATLHHADMRDALRSMPENSVDSVVCDPPYHLTSIVKRFGATSREDDNGTGARARAGADGLARMSRGFMGRVWDGGDIAFQPDTWREVLRVLKPGGYCAAFGAPRNFGRLQCALFDAGFEERDTLLNMVDPNDAVVQFIESLSETQLDAFMRCMAQSDIQGILAWAFGTGFPKGQAWTQEKAQSGEQESIDLIAAGFEGFARAGPKPAFEPIVLARKPLSEPTVAANVLRWRTGALNIDKCRVGTEGSRTNSSAKRAERNGFVKGFVGGTKTTIHDQGRWPANIITDGSDEVVGAFPSTAPAKAAARGLQHSGRHGGLADIGGNIKEGTNTVRGHSDAGGSAARFFYSAKASKADRAGSKHPTVKPISLMEWLCTLITPPGGTVLDPFAGSGTTGVAARNKGFGVVLCEREAEYVADIRSRFGVARVVLPDLRYSKQEIAAWRQFEEMLRSAA